MAKIKFFCPECGKAIEVERDLAGSDSFCPHCNQGITIPDLDSELTTAHQPVESPRPQLRSQQNKSCPKCHKAVGADAVICVNCGTDLRTGKEFKLAPSFSLHPSALCRPIVYIPVALLLVGVISVLSSLVRSAIKANEMTEMTNNIASIQSAFITITNIPLNDASQFDNMSDELNKLGQRALSLSALDWTRRCEEYATYIKERKLAFLATMQSLSNQVGSFTAAGNYTDAVKLLQEYRGDFAAETAVYRYKQITMLNPAPSAPEENARKAEADSAVLIKTGVALTDQGRNADAFDYFKRAADLGSALGQTTLGACYCNGSGVVENKAEAINWFRKASEQGFAQAQEQLGVCYANGLGVVKDTAEAVSWFRKAAEQGLADAQFNLGGCYFDGEGVIADKAEAAKWWHKAAEQGDAKAQNNLGNSYCNGDGVVQDIAEGVKWLRKAAEQGNAKARQTLKQIQQAGAPEQAQAVNLKNHLKQTYGAYYGVYQTHREAENAADALNANQQGSIDAMRESVSRSGGGAAVGNFQVRHYRVHHDVDTGFWVVY